MEKILAKSLKDARKEGNLILGTKQVRDALESSKLVVMSRSTDGSTIASEIETGAKAKKIPLVQFEGTSVALGRACGLQFRTATVAFTSLAETNINAIVKDAGIQVTIAEPETAAIEPEADVTEPHSGDAPSQ